MSQTDRILPRYFLSRVRVSVRPRFLVIRKNIGAIVYLNCNRSAIGVSDCHCVDHQRHRRRASLTPSWLDRPTTERPRRWGVFVCLFGCLFGNAYKLCVCMRACVRACVRVCVCTCVHEMVCMCVRAREFVCARVHAYVRACVQACVRACVRMCVRMCGRAGFVFNIR